MGEGDGSKVKKLLVRMGMPKQLQGRRRGGKRLAHCDFVSMRVIISKLYVRVCVCVRLGEQASIRSSAPVSRVSEHTTKYAPACGRVSVSTHATRTLGLRGVRARAATERGAAGLARAHKPQNPQAATHARAK